jgi:hypothetical protein
MSEWTNVPAEVRQNYACKVCGNYPDEEGVLDHGRGCYMLDENGGGSEYIDPPEHLPQSLTPTPPAKRLEVGLGLCKRLTQERDEARQQLTAAQARIAELEGENEQLRKGAPLGPIVGAQTIVEQEIELKRLRPLQTKLAGLADLADQWAAASHTPMGEAYLVTKTQMANELKQAIAADLVADAVAERCEENTNG